MGESEQIVERRVVPAADNLMLRTYLRMSAYLLMLVVFWGLAHRYIELGFDAQLYAFQAIAKLYPGLANDLFLQNASQDKFSVFSSIFAQFIAAFGLPRAALGLSILFTVGFYLAALDIARTLFDRDKAWLAAGIAAVIVGNYGAYAVFHYSEDFLTARSAAEFLVVTAIACHLRGAPKFAILPAITALAVHPIMAFPGFLTLAYLWLSPRKGLGAALFGIAACLSLAVLARYIPAAARAAGVMDGDWLYIVQERSQFLFPNLWTFADWELNFRPFVCLTFIALALPDRRIQRLCTAFVLVGVLGLATSLIAALVCPIAIFVQAQTWRWLWLPALMSVLLLPPTILNIWRYQPCGLICSTLMALAWTFPALDSLLCSSGALFLWMIRNRLGTREQRLLQWLAIAIILIIGIWAIGNLWTIVKAPFDTGRDPLILQTVKNFLGLQVPMVALIWLIWDRIRRLKTAAGAATIGVALAISLVFVLPSTFKQTRLLSVAHEPEEFKDWLSRIPESSSVVLITGDTTGSFVWFSLHRPAYLSEAQSAGVIFSRETALEIRRRSTVLAPLMEPDWKILSEFRAYAADPHRKVKPKVRALTAPTLKVVCKDPMLGFVIAREDVGFGAIRHTVRGQWKDWNLYDCNYVRSISSANETAV